MDILFKNDDFVFSYRVGGILKHNGKILLQRPKNDDYAIIGGHVAAMETSMETLKREFEEELHAKIEVDNLLAIGEIYFPWGKRPCHQICLYYNVHLMDDNDVYNAMMDATYTYTGDFNKIGNTNLLKEFLVKQGRETGEALFGDKKLGETMGNWVYTGLDIVSFLNGVDQLGKSFGKFQTAITGTAGTSKVWGEIHMKDVIENTHKLYKKDGIIKTVLRIDPTSVGNFGYDVVTGAMKAIQSAGKLGSTIADLAFG